MLAWLWKNASVRVEVAVCVCKHICVLGTGVDGPGIGPVLGLWRRVPAAC